MSSIFSRKLACATAVSLILAGCGGSNGTDTSTNTDTTTLSSGKFIDTAVQGLTYRTETQEGKTSSTGEYKYQPGENVDFYVGDIYLGGTKAGSTATPLDFIGEDDASHQRYVNVLRFLQTIDSDGDPSNGPIVIADGAGVGVTDISFDKSSQEFENDPAVTGFVALNANTNLISDQDAADHFSNSLSSIDDPTVVVDYRGATITEEVRITNTTNSCQSDWVQQAVYSDFTDTGFTLTDSEDETALNTDYQNCTVTLLSTPDVGTYAYTDVADVLWLKCGINCTYTDMNQSFIGTDEFSNTVEQYVAYDTTNKVLRSYERIINQGVTIESRYVITYP